MTEVSCGQIMMPNKEITILWCPNVASCHHMWISEYFAKKTDLVAM